ncbi:MAG: VCBS repeat-containing protein [Desulfobacteraceae bacterium]|nr:VCBS repeat-containing protein [Desulfobacteraceae bacterium]
MFLTSDRVCAGNPQTIAIFPFEVLSQDDEAFLGKGLTRMVCSRVGDTGEIQVQCRRKSLKDSNIEIVPGMLETLAGENAFSGINFLVKGSLTIMGATISTDAELIDLNKGRVVCYFHESGTSREDILRHAAVISEKIKAVVLGGAVPAARPETFGSTGAAPLVNEVEKSPGGIAANQLSKPEVPVSVSKAPVSVDPVFRSRTFNTEFTGLGSGDVDGDGHADIVLIDEHSLNLFSLQNGTLVKKGQFKGKRYKSFKAVDVADVNRNGKAEIFVTCVDRKAGVCSFVLEWSQGAFKTIVKESDWYFRVVSIDGEKRLFGQQGGYSELFSGGVCSLAWDGAGFEKAGAVSLPPKVDIFSFAKGDLLGAGAEQTLWLDDQGKLTLSRSAVQAEWSNSSSFGSTPFFLGEKAGQASEDQQRHYINTRMAVADLDQDGRNEAIVVHNRDLSKGFLNRFRKFTAGSIKCLAWNASGMRTLWETAQVDGYIADWALEDLDNDGRVELIYCMTRDKGTLLNKKRSVVAVEKL